MSFSSPLEARQFLIDKIIGEAGRTATVLCDAERRMLQLNLKEPQSATGIPVELLEDKDRTFEKKIVLLLQGAYERDRGHSQERQKYKDAVRELENSDHYILIIAAEAIPARSRGSNFVLYFIVALAIALMILGLQMWTK